MVWDLLGYGGILQCCRFEDVIWGPRCWDEVGGWTLWGLFSLSLSFLRSFPSALVLRGYSCCNAALWTTGMRHAGASTPLWSMWKSRLLPWMSSLNNNRRLVSAKKPPPRRIWRNWNSRCLCPGNSYPGPWCLQESKRVLQIFCSLSISMCFLICRFFFVFFCFHTCRFFLFVL